MATDLYHRAMAFDYGDGERSEIMHKVWDGFPWMVNAYTGGYSNNRDREHKLLSWCYDQFGQQASPIHDRQGTWLRGNATVDSWTWMGFATEADMNRFIEQWPTPDGVLPQS